MTQVDKDEERENRIAMEIVVDAYGEDEQALGWYNYMDSQLHFPFTATCIAQRSTSPLEPNDVVKVVGQPSEEDCRHEMLVNIQWKKRLLAVPLAQLEYHGKDEDTQQAIADWHYWVNRAHSF